MAASAEATIWYPAMMLILCNSFDDLTSLNEIYRHQNFRWVAVVLSKFKAPENKFQ